MTQQAVDLYYNIHYFLTSTIILLFDISYGTQNESMFIIKLNIKKITVKIGKSI